jgi:hypothetical protein
MLSFAPGNIKRGDSVRLSWGEDERTGRKRFVLAKVIRTKVEITEVLVEYRDGECDGHQEWLDAKWLDLDKNGRLISFGAEY